MNIHFPQMLQNILRREDKKVTFYKYVDKRNGPKIILNVISLIRIIRIVLCNNNYLKNI